MHLMHSTIKERFTGRITYHTYKVVGAIYNNTNDAQIAQHRAVSIKCSCMERIEHPAHCNAVNQDSNGRWNNCTANKIRLSERYV